MFPRLKTALEGHRFQDANKIEHNTTEQFKSITLERIRRSLEKWQHRWDHCTDVNYFDTDVFSLFANKCLYLKRINYFSNKTGKFKR